MRLELNSISETRNFINKIHKDIVVLVVLLVAIYFTTFYNYLLFHSISELFYLIILFGVFVIALNARNYMDNPFFTYLGTSFLFIGLIEALHLLTYRGMGVIDWPEPTNLPTQLWVAGSYLTAFSFLSAVLISRKKIRLLYVFLFYFVVTSLIILSIFFWRNFPVCYAEGEGLTAFKKISEYIISSVLLLTAGIMFRYRNGFDKRVFYLIISSMIVLVGAELAFSLYVDVYGIFNMVGHFLLVVSAYLIYKAIVETGLSKPYNLLFVNLKKSEEAGQKRAAELARLNDDLHREMAEKTRVQEELDKNRKELEKLVEERTLQLRTSYYELEKEIAERRHAEDELRILSNRTVEVQEEERQAISRELHDQTGQSLTVLNLVLSRIKRCVQTSASSTLENIDEAQKIVKEVMQQVRALSTTLHPSMLDNIGLVSTLEWYTTEFSARTGIKIIFLVQGKEDNLPQNVRNAAYRCIQESLTNIARYANVNEARVSLEFDLGRLRILVEDKGLGFNSAKLPVTSIGLRGMKERIYSLRGSIDIATAPGEGTRIEVLLPIAD